MGHSDPQTSSLQGGNYRGELVLFDHERDQVAAEWASKGYRCFLKLIHDDDDGSDSPCLAPQRGHGRGRGQAGAGKATPPSRRASHPPSGPATRPKSGRRASLPPSPDDGLTSRRSTRDRKPSTKIQQYAEPPRTASRRKGGDVYESGDDHPRRHGRGGNGSVEQSRKQKVSRVRDESEERCVDSPVGKRPRQTTTPSKRGTPAKRARCDESEESMVESVGKTTRQSAAASKRGSRNQKRDPPPPESKSAAQRKTRGGARPETRRRGTHIIEDSEEVPPPRGRGRGTDRSKKVGVGTTAHDDARRRDRRLMPLTQQEKIDLQIKIDQLDENQLESVLNFLASDLADSADGEEIQLDLDKLVPQRQHALVDMVDAQRLGTSVPINAPGSQESGKDSSLASPILPEARGGTPAAAPRGVAAEPAVCAAKQQRVWEEHSAREVQRQSHLRDVREASASGGDTPQESAEVMLGEPPLPTMPDFTLPPGEAIADRAEEPSGDADDPDGPLGGPDTFEDAAAANKHVLLSPSLATADPMLSDSTKEAGDVAAELPPPADVASRAGQSNFLADASLAALADASSDRPAVSAVSESMDSMLNSSTEVLNMADFGWM